MPPEGFWDKFYEVLYIFISSQYYRDFAATPQ